MTRTVSVRAEQSRAEQSRAEQSRASSVPRVIHYCWFGGNPLDEKALKCIASWKQYFPDWQIIRWDESNFDINQNEFMRKAYQDKKWAFVSDVARLIILYQHGGIYFDTDVEVICPFDDVLAEAESGFWGFEKSLYVSSGLGCGSVAGHAFLKENIEVYEAIDYDEFRGRLADVSCPILTTGLMEKRGLERSNRKQTVSGYTIYPSEYFSPVDYLTGKMEKTPNTHTIHWFAASWYTEEEKREHRKLAKLRRIFGTGLGESIYGITSCMKQEGPVRYVSARLKRILKGG